MKRLIAFYRNSKLKTKLFIIFGFSSLLPILLLWGISTKVNESALTEKVDQVTRDNLQQIAERANMSLEIYANLLYQMSQDEEMTAAVKTLMKKGGDAVAYNRLNRRLKQYNDMEGEIRCITVVCANGTSVAYDSQTDSAIDNLWRSYPDLRMIPPYRDAQGEAGMVLTPTVKFLEGEQYSHYFHISKRIFDLNNLDRGSIATIIVSVNEDNMDLICNPTGETEDSGFNFIVAGDGTVISYPDEEFAGRRIEDEESVARFVRESGLLGERQTQINAYQDERTGWVFYNVYELGAMLEDVRRTQMIFLLVGGMALGIAVVFILYFARLINRSVNDVVEGMQEVSEGNLEVMLPIHSDDEFGRIAGNFNQMTGRVNALVEEVKEATTQQKNAEIAALEAQINPHFLYNTLDSINWMAIDRGEYEISKMLRDLGVILRYSIGKSNTRVKAEAAVDWLEKYIGLQKVRFDNIFSYEITMDEAAGDCLVYKLLLQPFIENAILHGFKEMEGGGMLRVDLSLSEDKEFLHITIEDNGRGMPREQAQRYHDRAWAVRGDGTAIGLHNAFSRMDMYYGERASWKVTSIENMGTVIMLRLPAEWRETDEDTDRRGRDQDQERSGESDRKADGK